MKNHHTVVVLADAYRARVFTLENKKQQGGVPGPALIERAGLVNPGRRQRPSEQLSDTRPGSHRSPGGPGHAVDDHRDAKFDEADRKFAGDVVSKTAEVVANHDGQRVLYVAGPNMIGNLRKHLGSNTHPAPEFVDKELTKLSPTQVLEHLQKHEGL